MTGAAGENGFPEPILRRLLDRAEEKDAIGCEETVHAGQQHSARLLGKVKEDIAQQDHIESIAKRKGRVA